MTLSLRRLLGVFDLKSKKLVLNGLTKPSTLFSFVAQHSHAALFDVVTPLYLVHSHTYIYGGTIN